MRRENYLYVGMDLHKVTHTAVLVNCWNEKLDVIVIENKPSEFSKPPFDDFPSTAKKRGRAKGVAFA